MRRKPISDRFCPDFPAARLSAAGFSSSPGPAHCRADGQSSAFRRSISGEMSLSGDRTDVLAPSVAAS